jgi:hypothetical protein
MNTRKIARVCHEANRAYCSTTGDESQVPWGEAPDWQQESAVSNVVFHLETLEAGGTLNPAHSHEGWLQDKQEAGWTYGPVKDANKKEHPCMVPFEQLPSEQQFKDLLFAAIVEAYWNAAKPQEEAEAPAPPASTKRKRGRRKSEAE